MVETKDGMVSVASIALILFCDHTNNNILNHRLPNFSVSVSVRTRYVCLRKIYCIRLALREKSFLTCGKYFSCNKNQIISLFMQQTKQRQIYVFLNVFLTIEKNID